MRFVPGPFTLGRGWFGRIVNGIAIFWTLFECTILSIPLSLPITAPTFNYSWVIMLGVVLCALIWYVVYAHRHYHGPRSTMTPELLGKLGVVTSQEEGEVDAAAPAAAGEKEQPAEEPH